LRTTSAAFLVSSGPISSDLDLPAPIISIPPAVVVPADLLSRRPDTPAEAELQETMKTMLKVSTAQQKALLHAHAHLVLQQTYVTRVKAQVAEEEQKRIAKSARKPRILGDGMPHLLTHDEFCARVDAAVRVDRDKARQQASRAAGLDRWKAAVAAWKHIYDAAQERNDQIKARFTAAKLAYIEEVAAAELEGRSRQLTCPKRGPLEKIPPKP
ncbi:hypothetical protein BKA62DRAFT_602429, partial [Auriculariales sp. MPI-PUGE-AT-0066]